MDYLPFWKSYPASNWSTKILKSSHLCSLWHSSIFQENWYNKVRAEKGLSKHLGKISLHSKDRCQAKWIIYEETFKKYFSTFETYLDWLRLSKLLSVKGHFQIEIIEKWSCDTSPGMEKAGLFPYLKTNEQGFWTRRLWDTDKLFIIRRCSRWLHVLIKCAKNHMK